MDEKLKLYTREQLAEFRKSIQAMGTEVKNGTIEIPQGHLLTKGRRAIAPIRPIDVVKARILDIHYIVVYLNI